MGVISQVSAYFWPYNEWVDGWMGKYLDGCNGGSLDGWMDVWMDV